MRAKSISKSIVVILAIAVGVLVILALVNQFISTAESKVTKYSLCNTTLDVPQEEDVEVASIPRSQMLQRSKHIVSEAGLSDLFFTPEDLLKAKAYANEDFDDKSVESLVQTVLVVRSNERHEVLINGEKKGPYHTEVYLDGQTGEELLAIGVNLDEKLQLKGLTSADHKKVKPKDQIPSVWPYTGEALTTRTKAGFYSYIEPDPESGIRAAEGVNSFTQTGVFSIFVVSNCRSSMFINIDSSESGTTIELDKKNTKVTSEDKDAFDRILEQFQAQPPESS